MSKDPTGTKPAENEPSGRGKSDSHYSLWLFPHGPKLAMSFAAIGLTTILGYAVAQSSPGGGEPPLSDLEQLGKQVFFDKISSPKRMACVTCHDPATGGTGSVSGVNLHQVAITGADPHTSGSLKPPTNAYASSIARFRPCSTGGLGVLNVCGGNFWNGRAEGNMDRVFPQGATPHIGEEIFYSLQGDRIPGVDSYAKYFGPTADQALNPMPNPVEQNIDRQAVCQHVASSKYAELYQKTWGEAIDCRDVPVAVKAPGLTDEKAFDISFKRLMLAVGAWQHSLDLNSFSSKRDKALRAELACSCAQGPDGANYPGQEICEAVGTAADPAVCEHANYGNSPGKFPLVGLTDQENLGHDLFYATRFRPLADGKFSNCAFCHADNPVVPGPGARDDGSELFQLYSADDYHNIGTPRNPEIPEALAANGTPVDPDAGLAAHAGDPYPKGFFKTPSLRNVDKRKDADFIKAYTHNGWFKSLESLVHFYNTAAVGLPTANRYGVTRCPDGIDTEKEALANNCWPVPAYSSPGAIPFLVGNLNLDPEDEAAIVAYLKTFTDTWTPRAPKLYGSK